MRSIILLCLFISVSVQAGVCTDGSLPGKLNPRYCCKGPYVKGYVNEKAEWRDFEPQLCGCPDGGTLADDNVCCKDNLRYDSWELGAEWHYEINHPGQKMPEDWHTDKYKLLDPEHCGCPQGLNLSSNKRYCCRNGYAVIGNKESYEPQECGCPDDGQFNIPKDGGVACVKDNYMYDYQETKKYVLVYAEDWGCPEGSEQKGPVCCKGEYAYSNKSFAFDKVDAYCGCPDGGKPSEAFLKDKYHHPCCKGTYMYNPKTKRYDKENNLACNPEGAKKMAVSITRSLLKYSYKPGLEPLAHAAIENPDSFRESMEITELY
ncbi:MAG: hypothetical protein J6T55_00480 [Alphaproteobacteria bacterium]|nr:hypothetical protein [Alphaproteobacteria bacterium]